MQIAEVVLEVGSKTAKKMGEVKKHGVKPSPVKGKRVANGGGASVEAKGRRA